MLRPLETYQTQNGVFDEMLSPAGEIRPHWSFVMQSFDSLGVEEMNWRRQEASRLLKNNGVTYNITSEDARAERPWSLDVVPLILDSAEWNQIERGLMQRAELLDLILKDVYGSRELIRRGLLPPEVIYAHPGFLRPAVGTPHFSPHRLVILAADLARTPDGRIIVLADRAQAPSGSGYALENRIILSRTLPSIYRDAQVHRLAVYFRNLRSSLAALAPTRSDDPRIVILTPGPGSETYFEHAFLANYLGITLVQGSDLIVRDARVYVRTLEGLDPVDVILRRLDDVFCDPLELRPDSLLGAPGLLNAARMGNVAMANPIGSGVLDNPALAPYLPALSKALLGQELLLPSAATWWCGDPQHQSYVLDHLDELIIKPIFPRGGRRSIFAGQISENSRKQLADRIRAQPEYYVGQEQIPLSTLPHLVENRLEARPMILRTFCLSRGDDYVLMPGGLTRVSSDPDSPLVSNQRGGISKDTWVIASEPMRETTLLRPAAGALPITRSGGAVASRVADNIYWLGRYTERSENLIRLLREILKQLTDDEARLQTETRDALLVSLTHLTGSYPGFLAGGPGSLREAPESEVLDLIYNDDRAGALAFNINMSISAGRSVQDRLSDDAWRFLNALRDRLDESRAGLTDAALSLDALFTGLSAFAGVSSESMSRGQGWRFLDMGRRAERALCSLSVLRTVFGPYVQRDEALLETTLSIKDSIRTYRRRYQSRYQEEAVVDLLLLDESNPQSVAYQLAALLEHAANLPDSDARSYRSRESRLILEAITKLRLTETDGVVRRPGELENLMAQTTTLILGFSEALSEHYFVHTVLPRQF